MKAQVTHLKMRDAASQQFHDIIVTKKRGGQMPDAAFAETHNTNLNFITVAPDNSPNTNLIPLLAKCYSCSPPHARVVDRAQKC